MVATTKNSIANPVSVQRYLQCPGALYSETSPSASPKPVLIELNRNLLNQYGVCVDWFYSDEGLNVLAGNQSSEHAKTLALAYGGHQFGQWVPLLGDGRAHMLGQLTDSKGRFIDVQLKGSGRTPYSRGGDGRATLGSVLREYIVSEAMAGLDIATTRSLAVIATGEPVRRETCLPGALLVRTALSHLRVGTFQYAASTLDIDEFKAFVDFAIAQCDIENTHEDSNYTVFLDTVIYRQVRLIANWMLTGFIHGVMNTDNMSIAGETIDYGPCAFMDEFNPQKVFSSIDRYGRYAWDQQPSIGLWNLTRFAHTLLPVLDDSPEKSTELVQQSLEKFGPAIQLAFHEGFSRKLGVVSSMESLAPFIQLTFKALTEGHIDFTVFFDRLTDVADGEPDSYVVELFSDKAAGVTWVEQWRELRKAEQLNHTAMRRANPAVIARNHQVENAIRAAEDDNNFTPFRNLCAALATPYEVSDKHRELQVPPLPQERVTQTFCGT